MKRSLIIDKISQIQLELDRANESMLTEGFLSLAGKGLSLAGKWTAKKAKSTGYIIKGLWGYFVTDTRNLGRELYGIDRAIKFNSAAGKSVEALTHMKGCMRTGIRIGFWYNIISLGLTIGGWLGWNDKAYAAYKEKFGSVEFDESKTDPSNLPDNVPGLSDIQGISGEAGNNKKFMKSYSAFEKVYATFASNKFSLITGCLCGMLSIFSGIALSLVNKNDSGVANEFQKALSEVKSARGVDSVFNALLIPLKVAKQFFLSNPVSCMLIMFGVTIIASVVMYTIAKAIMKK